MKRFALLLLALCACDPNGTQALDGTWNGYGGVESADDGERVTLTIEALDDEAIWVSSPELGVEGVELVLVPRPEFSLSTADHDRFVGQTEDGVEVLLNPEFGCGEDGEAAVALRVNGGAWFNGVRGDDVPANCGYGDDA